MLEPRFLNSPHFLHYWNHGNGKQLLQWSEVRPTTGDFQKYSPLFYQVDELGDAVVQDTYLKLPYHEASQLVNNFAVNGLRNDDATPESLKKLFSKMEIIPDWFDINKANAGARLCMRSGTNALVILRDFTLMGGYDFAYLNKPLILTGALKKGAVKRLRDTLEFWVQVTREDALTLYSKAYQLIVRTRLMHSYARLSIKKRIANWDTTTWGEPINHWDMAATYLGFSLIFLQGLSKLGMKVTDEEEEGLFHLWKYIGYLLGIPEQFLMTDRAAAVRFFYNWTAVQGPGDDDSRQLAKSLLLENVENTIYKFMFQRKLLLKLHIACSQFLLDDEVADRLQIPKAGWSAAFPKLITAINKAESKKAKNSEFYNAQVQRGHKLQMKVLEDYIEHSPKDFHY